MYIYPKSLILHTMKIKLIKPLVLEITEVELDAKDFDAFMEGVKVVMSQLPTLFTMINASKKTKFSVEP